MSEISMGLTELEKAEFLNSVAVSFCPECGREVIQNPKGRRKKFCSDSCRFAWKNKHPKPECWKGIRIAVCPTCGNEFQAYRESKRIRKYCSHACANRGRAAEKRMEEQGDSR